MTSTVVVDGASLTCAAVTAVAAADRPLDGDLGAAEAALPGIAAVVSWSGPAR